MQTTDRPHNSPSHQPHGRTTDAHAGPELFTASQGNYYPAQTTRSTASEDRGDRSPHAEYSQEYYEHMGQLPHQESLRTSYGGYSPEPIRSDHRESRYSTPHQRSSHQPSSHRRPVESPQGVGQNGVSYILSSLFAGLRPKPSSVEGRSRSEAAQATSPTIGVSNLQYLVTGGCILMALALMTDVQQFIPKASSNDMCQDVVSNDAVLSREHLVQLLSVSERTTKTAIQQVVKEPYCRLAPVSIRAGVVADREAYPLAFDPDTWLVMLYEGDEYAGFDFSFRR